MIIPMTFCLFGATGDLTLSKLLPALWELYKKAPDQALHIVAVSRREIDTPAYIRLVLEYAHMPEVVKKDMIEYETFLRKTIRYKRVNIDRVKDYNALVHVLKSEYEHEMMQPLSFFLALSPDHYRIFIQTADASELGAYIKETKASLMLEKPFGHDEASAAELEKEMCGVMSDSAVYRLDHYLAKPAVMRLASLAEKGTLKKLIHAVKPAQLHVRLFETQTIRGRGAYYDEYGILGDVMQNHVLQMVGVFLGHVAVQSEKVEGETHEAHQAARARVFEHLILNQREDSIKAGRYEGYRDEEGVEPESCTPTYARVVYDYALKDGSAPIQVVVEAGKAMAQSLVTIDVENAAGESLVTFEVQPNQKIMMTEEAKKHIPQDLQNELMNAMGPRKNDSDAYETIFRDAAARNPARFVSFEEIIAAWRCIDSVREKIDRVCPGTYPVGWSPADKDVNFR